LFNYIKTKVTPKAPKRVPQARGLVQQSKTLLINYIKTKGLATNSKIRLG